MLRLRRYQTGETILEVLISLAVLGLILGVSYALASRSLRGSQDAQERTVASQLAQSQIEVIKTYAIEAEVMAAAGDASMVNALFPGSTATFCVRTDLTSVNARTLPLPAADPACRQDIYSVQVEVVPVPGEPLPTFDYLARVQWESGVSSITNEALLRYRWVRVTP